MSNVLFSIIIPTYNRYSLLKACLQSIYNQKFHDYELIIVDDGSTDNTRKLCSKFKSKINRLKYYFIDNSGAPFARNYGLSLSSGKYVIFHDSDDLMHDEKLFYLSKIINQYNPDGIVSSISYINSTNYLYKPKKLFFDNPIRSFLLGNLHGGTQSWTFLKEKISNINGYDNLLICKQDLDLTFRFLMNMPRVVSCKSAVTFFHEHNGDRISKKAESIYGIQSTIRYHKKRFDYINSLKDDKLIFNEIKELLRIKIKCKKYNYKNEYLEIKFLLNSFNVNFFYKSIIYLLNSKIIPVLLKKSNKDGK